MQYFCQRLLQACSVGTTITHKCRRTQKADIDVLLGTGDCVEQTHIGRQPKNDGRMNFVNQVKQRVGGALSIVLLTF